MVVAFLPDMSMTISRYVASIFSNEWGIAIAPILREFWMLERKLETIK